MQDSLDPGAGRHAVWPALLVAPSVALGHLSLAYAWVSPACARQDALSLHALSLASLVLCLVLTLSAWRRWTREAAASPGRRVTRSDAPHGAARASFIGLVATLVGSLSTLAIAAMWVPVWMLSPCS